MKAYSGSEKYIFVSYAHKNSDTVLPIMEALDEAGFRIWYDQGIEAGEEWPAFIEEHLTNCETVLVFMSNDTVNSLNCRNEINLAVTLKKNILVVYLEYTVLRHGLALQLGTSQSIPLYKQTSSEEFFENLFSVKILLPCSDQGEHVIPDKKIPVRESTEKKAESHQATLFLERVFLFLESGAFDKADEYCEKVLDLEPKNAEAYLGKLMVERKIKQKDALIKCSAPLDTSTNYAFALKFGDEVLVSQLEGYNDAIKKRLLEKENTTRYQKAEALRQKGKKNYSPTELEEAAKLFASLGAFKDAADKVGICMKEQMEAKYACAILLMEQATTITAFEEAAKGFAALGDYRDSPALAQRCLNSADQVRAANAEKKQKANEYKQQVAEHQQKRDMALRQYQDRYPVVKREKEILDRYQKAQKACKELEKTDKSGKLLFVAGIIFLFIVPFVGIGLLVAGCWMTSKMKKAKQELDAANKDYQVLLSIPPFSWDASQQ